MPRGHYQRKAREAAGSVPEALDAQPQPQQPARASVLGDSRMLRLELIRVVGAPGLSADRIIAVAQALERYVTDPAGATPASSGQAEAPAPQ